MDSSTSSMNTVRPATAEEIDRAKKDYLSAKDQLAQKIADIQTALQTDQPIEGKKRRELANMLTEAQGALFNRMDVCNYEYWEKLNLGVTQMKFME